MLYFDHSATTPPYSEVIDAMTTVLRDYYGNASSLHRLGVDAERLLSKARETCATSLRVSDSEIVFTSGGSESNNAAIKGVACRTGNRGRHIIASAVEHSSVYKPLKQLEEHGFRITFIPVDETGAVRADDVIRAVTDETILVSVMHVNNETGRIQPVEEIADALRRRRGVLFHVDAVQSIGRVSLDLAASGIDLASFSAHKFRGPKGVGLLYKREGVALPPLIAGGAQERGIRAGTENTAGIVGAAKALRMTVERQAEGIRHMKKLREQLIDRLRPIEHIRFHGSSDEEHMSPHIVNFSVPGVKGEVLVHALEQRGMYVSTQAACSSGLGEPSRVLTAMGASRDVAASSVRISLSFDHTEEQTSRLAAAVYEAANELSSLTARDI